MKINTSEHLNNCIQHGFIHRLRRNPFTVLVGRTHTLIILIQSKVIHGPGPTYSTLRIQSALLHGLRPARILSKILGPGVYD